MTKVKGMQKTGCMTFCLIVLCMFWITSFAHAQNTQVDNGLTWLKAAQKADGSWGSRNTFRDTSTVIDSYRFLGKSDSSYQNAVTWLNGFTLESNDYLVKRITSLSGSGANVSADVQQLISSQK